MLRVPQPDEGRGPRSDRVLSEVQIHVQFHTGKKSSLGGNVLLS
jgi:hypothetical protein